MNKPNEITATIISIIALSLSIFSCKENINLEKENEKVVLQNEINKPIDFEFDFPDTIYVNKVYEGTIKFKSILDTITTSFEDDKKSRYTLYYMKKTKEINYDIEKLKTMKLDTFGAVNNTTIPFYNIKFTELGVHYIDGIINDHVSIDTINKSRRSDDNVRYIENVVRATYKIIVIKEPNSK